MNSVRIYIICGIVAMFLGLVSFFAYTNYSLSKELAKTKEKLAECNVSIEVQNKAIEKLRVDTEAFKQDMEQENKNIQARYESLQKITPKTCKQQMQKIDNALQIFYDRK